jgi:two-component system nitrogen regulation response regulator GlnG
MSLTVPASRQDPPSVSQADTLVGDKSMTGLTESGRYPCLTILYHPNMTRVGERAILAGLVLDRVESLSRLGPDFAPPGVTQGRSLRDPYVSRRPTQLRRVADTIEIAPEPGTPVELDGVSIDGVACVAASSLEAGVILTLARRVVLLLHSVTLRSEYPPHWQLVGEGDAIVAVREQVARVADLEVPVLIRGATGVGKERVAQSIHEASHRAQRPLVTVNMAALAPGTAPSELFGHVRGAFTHAVTGHVGLFERAHGSTLFLDEIGETPPDVQTMLLRALAEGTIRPMGARSDRQVDVRVLAATDADLDRASAEGRFRTALRHRLAGYEIYVPPLCERREDIPRLVVHFLREELGNIGEAWRLSPPETSKHMWFPPELMLRLFHHHWPGNVRQLRNTVRQIVISSRGAAVVRVDVPLARALSKEPLTGAPGPGSRSDPRADPGTEVTSEPRLDPIDAPDPFADDEITEEQALALELLSAIDAGVPAGPELSDDALLAAMAASRWSPARAAELLGMARGTLYDRLERVPGLRKASDLSREELEHVYRQCGGDLDAMVDHLRVSKRSIQLRMHALGIDYSGNERA